MITTERLILRAWIDADIPAFIQMNKDADVMNYFPKTLTDTETLEMVERIQLHFQKNNFGLFAAEEKHTHEFIGYTGFAIPRFDTFFTPCVEIGWRYKKEYWGKGLATEAANACIEYGFNTLGFDKIVSFTSVLNKRSENVMKRVGMHYVADFDHPAIEKDHPICPHVLYQLSKSDWQVK